MYGLLPASMYVPGAHGGQNTASGALELESEMVVRHLAGVGNQKPALSGFPAEELKLSSLE